VRGGGEHGLQVEVVGLRDQRVAQDRRERRRSLHQVGGTADAGRQGLGQARGDGRGIRDDDVDPAEVSSAGVVDGVERRTAVVGEDGVGESLERGGDRGLESG
jgi:hypothetical protein